MGRWGALGLIACSACGGGVETIGADGGAAEDAMVAREGDAQPADDGVLDASQVPGVNIDRFEIVPQRILRGQTATIAYAVTHASRVRITRDGADVLLDGATAFSGSVPVRAETTARYTLTAEGPGGPRSAEATLTVVPPATIRRFTATPPVLEPAETSTLAWDTDAAARVELRDDHGATLSTSPSGVVAVRPAADATYTLSAFDALGGRAEATASVSLRRTPRVLTFAAEPARVGYGEPAALRWDVQRADAVEITRQDGVTATVSSARAGRVALRPTQTATYILTARNSAGTATSAATLAVDPTPPRIAMFDANAALVLLGDDVELSWSVSGADRVVIDDQTGTRFADTTDPIGAVMARVRMVTATFTLIATNPHGEARARVTVLGWSGAPPAIANFLVTPDRFTGSAMIDVEWRVTESVSTTLTIDGRPAPGFPGIQAGRWTFTSTRSHTLQLTATNPVGSASELRHVFAVRSIPEVGNTVSTATPLAAIDAVSGDLTAGDADWYTIDVPEGASVWARLESAITGGCVNAPFALIGPAPETREVAVASGLPNLCLVLDPERDRRAAELPAGRYTIRVSGPGNGAYVLRVRVILPSCGNRIAEHRRGEECDDGGRIGGGCNASCSILPAGVLMAPGASAVFRGSIDVPGGGAWVRLFFTEPGYLDARTYVPSRPDCDGSIKTSLVLMNAAFETMRVGSDAGTSLRCSQLTSSRDRTYLLAAGTYWLRVGEFFEQGRVPSFEIEVNTRRSGCGDGILDPGEACDDGNLDSRDGCSATCTLELDFEREPNDFAGVATPYPGAGRFNGTISSPSDRDWIAITVPEGRHLDIAPVSAIPCPAAVQPRLQLHSGPAIAPVYITDNGGSCGRIWPHNTPAVRAMRAGTYYLSVSGTAGPYTLDLRVVEPGCGNGIFEGAEACDDGNTRSGDGCSAACALEPARTITLPSPAVFDSASIDPPQARRALRLDVTAPVLLSAETFTPSSIPGACDADTRLTLLRADGATVVGFDEDSGPGACSAFDPRRDLYARLSTGAYFLVAEESGNDRPIPSLGTSVRGAPLAACGNGVKEVARGEQCDDGNTLAGDGCNPTCSIEPEAVFTGPAPTQVFTTSLDGAPDLYRVVLPVPSILVVSTGAPSIGACVSPLSITVLDALADAVLIVPSGGGCQSLLAGDPRARLAAGTYFLRVSSPNAPVVNPYQLSVTLIQANFCGNGVPEYADGERCDDGNANDADGCTSTCELTFEGDVELTIGGGQSVSGTLDSSRDIDIFRLRTSTTVLVRAEVELSGGRTCAPGQVELGLSTSNASYTSGGGGPGGCPRSTWMRLPPPRQYIGISQRSGTAGLGDYTIRFTTIAADVCGNGIVEPSIGEECEDGGVAPGDGCGPDCKRETLATHTTGGPPIVYSGAYPGSQTAKFRLVVLAPSVLRAEIFIPSYGSCASTSVALNLEARDGPTMRLFRNSAVSGFDCFLIHQSWSQLTIDPGTYFLSVIDNSTPPFTPLEARIHTVPLNRCGNGVQDFALGEECDDEGVAAGDGCGPTCRIEGVGAEVEPNGTFATATPTGLVGFGLRTLTGTIAAVGDGDLYSFEVPAGAERLSLRARVYTGAASGGSTFCPGTLGNNLVLFDANGVSRAGMESTSTGVCGAIDGERFGMVGARSLAPGRYYLRVSQPEDVPPRRYRVEVQLLREP